MRLQGLAFALCVGDALHAVCREHMILSVCLVILETVIKKSKQVCLIFSVQSLRFTALYRILNLLRQFYR